VKHFSHAANVTVEWSNGFKETVGLTLTDAEQGKHYAVLAVELNPDQQSKDVTLEVKYLGDELLPSLRYQRIEGERGPPELGAALWFFLWPLVFIWAYRESHRKTLRRLLLRLGCERRNWPKPRMGRWVPGKRKSYISDFYPSNSSKWEDQD
jgi:hypothetical protein